MDAGLAAVLGAAVGAIGTGGAGIGGALLARSQARSQLQAEHARIIREPRKAAYIALAEAILKDHNKMVTTISSLQVVAENRYPAAYEDRMRAAQEAYESTHADDHSHGHRYAQVAVEGPPTVTQAAADCRGAFLEFKAQVHVCLVQFQRDGGGAPEAIASLDELSQESHRAYLAFVHAAASAIAVDGVNSLAE
ncbi:hypothetical protein GCM10011579_039250 [Streptomyces albiflavescens]|uniref:Uncharacterized protein n=1 Tax=Streptomyces albiflavescens TaxID=1623582 RepID=A0A917Y632_9ACTN|nr:hypothetical protein [Streptomyces albiflavescens]GGN67111.1 hypothetical protein GCM10011579_039250 [Streptomyces albiflavescens]